MEPDGRDEVARAVAQAEQGFGLVEEAGADFKDGLEVDLEVAFASAGADEHLRDCCAVSVVAVKR